MSISTGPLESDFTRGEPACSGLWHKRNYGAEITAVGWGRVIDLHTTIVHCSNDEDQNSDRVPN